MRLIGHPLRRRRGQRGQALVEFAMVITMFITVVVAIIEFAFFYSSYASIAFASKDSAQLAATYGDTMGADAAILQRINQDVNTPADPKRITFVEIYWVDTAAPDARPVGGAVTKYRYDGGSHTFTKPDLTTIQLPFVQDLNGYPEDARCNVNLGVGCKPGHTTIDTIAVKITYQYLWVTPFPGLVGGSSTGPSITSTNIMRLEPVL